MFDSYRQPAGCRQTTSELRLPGAKRREPLTKHVPGRVTASREEPDWTAARKKSCRSGRFRSTEAARGNGHAISRGLHSGERSGRAGSHEGELISATREEFQELHEKQE